MWWSLGQCHEHGRPPHALGSWGAAGLIGSLSACRAALSACTSPPAGQASSCACGGQDGTPTAAGELQDLEARGAAPEMDTRALSTAHLGPPVPEPVRGLCMAPAVTRRR